MPLDPVIAQGFRGIELQNPLDAYARVNQLQQAQQQNQLNALKMQEYQRENATNNALNQAYQAAYNPNTGAYDMNRLRGEVIRGGAGAKLPGIEKQIGELRTQQLAQSKAEAEAVTQKLAQSRTLLDTIDPADPSAPQRFMAWHEVNHTDPVLGPVLQRMGVTADQSRARIAQAAAQGPAALADLIAQSREGQTKFAERFKPITVAPGASVYRPGDAGAMFTAPGAAPRLADKFVPVGRLVFDRETGQFITPPAAAIAATQDRGAAAPAKEPVVKPLTAAQEVARRDKLGKEYKSATSALQTTQDVLDSIASVKSSPGLSRATGFSGTMLPSFPEGQAAQAETRLANLKGKVTALGKAAAAASGAIGSIANQEWKILADQIANIDPVKGTGPLLEQIDLVEAQALGAMERIRDAYSRQFGEDFERFPQFGNLPQPKSTQRKPAGAAAPAGASGTFTAPPPAAIDALKKGQGTDAQFDELFGPGAAARARGR